MKRYVIDSHSHIGQDIFHGKTNLEEYIDFAIKSRVNVGVLMGVPSPCNDLNDVKSRYMYWKYDGQKIIHFGMKNPFLKLNYELYNQIKSISNAEINLLFVPTFHPVLDEIDEFEKMLFYTDPIAIKIHGIGSGIGPNDITSNYIDLIKSFNIPIIVHTDCDFGKGSESMNFVRNINNAKLWAEFFEKNKIKGILNHGACLDKETFNIVNKSNFLMIAIGPDKIACLDNNRLFIDCLKDYRNYLNYLKNNVDIFKLIFDVDYNWNKLHNEVDDYESVARIEEIFEVDDDINRVLSGNLLEFNPKILSKVREKNI